MVWLPLSAEVDEEWTDGEPEGEGMMLSKGNAATLFHPELAFQAWLAGAREFFWVAETAGTWPRRLNHEPPLSSPLRRGYLTSVARCKSFRSTGRNRRRFVLRRMGAHWRRRLDRPHEMRRLPTPCPGHGKNTLYMSHYRAKLKADHECDAVRSSLLKELLRLRSLVKNTWATAVSHCHADVWLISPSESESVKNTLC